LSNTSFLKTFIKLLMCIYTKIWLWINYISTVFLNHLYVSLKIIQYLWNFTCFTFDIICDYNFPKIVYTYAFTHSSNWTLIIIKHLGPLNILTILLIMDSTHSQTMPNLLKINFSIFLHKFILWILKFFTKCSFQMKMFSKALKTHLYIKQKETK
jgi:hypothetical protein